MRTFGPRSRIAAAAAGLAAFAAAYATTPLSARDGIGTSFPPASVPSASAREREPIVVPARDPFAYVEGTRPVAAAPAAPAALPQIPALLGPLPPNAGARGEAPPSPFRVEAVVTGPHPLALVAEGAATRLVGRGDAVAGSIVDDVRADGVHLRSGTVIAPAPDTATTQGPDAATTIAPPVPRSLPTPPQFVRQEGR